MRTEVSAEFDRRSPHEGMGPRPDGERDVPDTAALLRAGFDASPFATLYFTPDLVMLDANAAHIGMTGVGVERLAGRFMFDVFPKNPEGDGPDTEAIIRASVARVAKTLAADEVPVQRHDLPVGDGGFESRYWRLMHSPILIGGSLAAIRQDSWDVTEAVRREERLEALQRAATAVSNMAFWELDPDTDTFTRSPELDELFGFAPGEAGSEAAPFFARVHPDDADPVREAFADLMAAPLDAAAQIELRAAPPGGETLHLLMRAQPMLDGEGRRVLIGTTLDVTRLRRHERELARALEEKEMLLGEVNHRVKNSLQLVSSILAIGGRTETDPAVQAKLKAAAERVRAVATVHASLYQSGDVRTVALDQHLGAFCRDLAEGGGADARGIRVEVDLCPARVRTDKAVALSLIVNELVTNSLKYAFADDAAGDTGEAATIRVRLERRADGTLTLTVADNGVGGTGTASRASSGIVNTRVKGLGSRLVPSLATQINARVSQSHDDGWITQVSFEE